MSTRAIVGYMQPDGSVIAGWQWYDGQEIGSVLRKYFSTFTSVKNLVKCGVWSVLLTPRDTNLDMYKQQSKDFTIEQIERCWVIKRMNRGCDIKSFEPGITIVNNVMLFKDLIEAMGQDVNYVYIFNPKTSKWKTFGRKYTYEKLKEKCNKILPNKMLDMLETL